VIAKFDTLPDLQVDVAIAERSSSIQCVPMSINWSDVGSWDRIEEVRNVDDNYNLLEGNVHGRDSENNLVWIENTKKLVVINNADDLVVVDTVNALYISSK